MRHHNKIRRPAINLVPENDVNHARAMNELKIMEKIMQHKKWCALVNYTIVVFLLICAASLASKNTGGWQLFLIGGVIVWAIESVEQIVNKIRANSPKHTPPST